MQLAHRFLLLLLFSICATSDGIVATNDHTDTLQATRNRPLTMVDHASVNDKNAESEERGIFSSVLSKIKPKDLSSKTKSTGLSSKINTLRKDSDVAAALGNSPVMKKLETAVENDPKFFTKLANNPESVEKLVKNPEVQQAAAALEKSKFKVTQNDINQLRTVVSKNPSKRAMLIKGLDGLEKLLWMGAVAGTVGVLLFLVVKMILAG